MSLLAAAQAATDTGSRAAGPLGLLVVVLLGVAVVLLVRNMDRRLRRLPREFPAPQERPAVPPQGEGPDAPGR